MAELVEYEVVNRHWGDKDGERHRYRRGAKRIGDPEDPDIRAHLKWGHLKPWVGKAGQNETDEPPVEQAGEQDEA